MLICGFGVGNHYPELWSLWKGETLKMPKLFHHLWHTINMEFAEECMRYALAQRHGRQLTLPRQPRIHSQRRQGDKGLLYTIQ